ncbi:MAG: ArsR/SmtB family transcription factor [Candidatus Heimdallarchaeaceae archaeon]
MNEDEHTTALFEALSHPIRRQILKKLAEEEEVSYTQLVETTNLKAGPLYHHLKVISNLIYQSEKKLYRLTEEGEKAIALLEASELGSIEQIKERTKVYPLTIFGFSLAPLVNYFAKHSYRTLVEFIVLSIILGYFAKSNSFLILGNFVISYRTTLLYSYLSIILSWLFLGGSGELFSRVIYKRKEKTVEFLSVTSLLFLPNFLFILTIWAISLFSSSILIIPAYLLYILYFFFQVWTFFILTTSLGVLKQLSVEKSAILALVINYFQMITLIFILIPP